MIFTHIINILNCEYKQNVKYSFNTNKKTTVVCTFLGVNCMIRVSLVCIMLVYI